MGRRICAIATSDARFELVAEVGHHDELVSVEADVVIDFATPQATPKAIEIARINGAALLVGTTGLCDGTLCQLEVSAQSCAVMVAPNTSVGAAVIARLVEAAARHLPGRFGVEIVETHHSRKIDSPSGTALRLASAVETGSGCEVGPEQVHSLRVGDVTGEHSVVFAGDDQVIKISHMAGSRDVFARGALDAAAWLCRQPSGWYTIEQSLGFEVP